MLAELDPKLAWYAARSGGWVALAVGVASLAWGLALSSRLVRRKGVPAWLLDLHRYLGTLTLAFTAVHLVGLWADNWLRFGPAELFVPMRSPYRPGVVTVGIVAGYLLLAIQLTSWAKRWLPRRWWHRIHLTSVPMVVLGAVHGFWAGTDHGVAFQWATVVAAGLLLFLVTFRLLARRPRRSSPGRTPEPSAAVI